MKLVQRCSDGGAGFPLGSFNNPIQNAAQMDGLTTGVYYLFCHATGQTVEVQIDDTEGGRWVLIANYVRGVGSNVAPVELSGLQSFPQYDIANNNLGDNQVAAPYYGTAKLNIIDALADCFPFDEVRFYGATTAHSRILHFKSSNKIDHVDRIVAGGGGTWATLLSAPGVLAPEVTLLTGHTAMLPASADTFDQITNGAPFNAVHFMQAQFFKLGAETYGIYRSGGRWEVDDFPTASTEATIHRCWLRVKP